ncbi:22632_t:CDS:2 [Dentiscutata erythropus]|uniref:22632_t:CDS:1 n=1 Tax=Dentiscutata erythropus TaxID=1348616 RepID=A0A9N8ZUH0_9GLOM|nr:22632_t:CDS:2 [Dentiscutata erythropus]
MVQNKAVLLAKSPKYILHHPNINNFKWSNKWLDGFLQCHNFSIHCKTTVAQKLPSELEAQWQEFLNFVQYRYDKRNKTISIKTCGYEKSCFTVVLTCLADGTKLPPMIIFKLKNVPQLEFPSGVVIRANESGWMNEMQMSFWIDKIWQNHTPSSENPRSLLIRTMYDEWILQEIRELTESG